jgi:predicted GNAT family acetyltransferase
MTWRLTHDVEEFRRAADPWMHADPPRHTLPLTISEALREDPSAGRGARFGWWREDGEPAVTGVFVQTPPRPPLIGPLAPRAAAELAGLLRADPSVPVTGVRGPADDARRFARAWTAGAEPREAERLLLYRLGELTPPRPAPEGRARRAERSDIPLVAAWFAAFADEVQDPPQEAAALRAEVARRVAGGRILLWVRDGAPVSLAGMSLPSAGQIRIAPVFTPRPLRGRGYAGAVTVAVSEAARGTGADEVLLFTDEANATSNALYARLGYRTLAAFLVLEW